MVSPCRHEVLELELAGWAGRQGRVGTQTGVRDLLKVTHTRLPKIHGSRAVASDLCGWALPGRLLPLACAAGSFAVLATAHAAGKLVAFFVATLLRRNT